MGREIGLLEEKLFDLVISISHNLGREECGRVLQEVEQVSRGKSFITVDIYRTEEEEDRMTKWNLTAKTMMSTREYGIF